MGSGSHEVDETSNGDVSYHGSYEAGDPNEGSGDDAAGEPSGFGVTPQFPVGTMNPMQKIQRVLYGFG